MNVDDKLFLGVNRPKDLNNLSDLEKKHIPTITAPDQVRAREPFEVKVEVGKELAHPDFGDHFIQYVELFCDDDAFLARLDFTPTVSGAPASITLKLNYDTVLKARARCNRHGIWETSHKIKVETIPSTPDDFGIT